MSTSDLVVYGIIGLNVLISLQGFNNPAFKEQYLFYEGKILWGKEYFRMLSSGFLHADFAHLAFNMYTFYIFAGVVADLVGPITFLVIYLGSLIGGNLLSLVINRNEPHYRALGASGAVSGVLYAFILICPDCGLSLFFIPIYFPAWVFGIAYIGLSIYGMSRNADNIGHDAHLGGAIIGLLLMLAYFPHLLMPNLGIVLAMVIPTLIFLYIMVKKPHLLRIGYKNKWDRWD